MLLSLADFFLSSEYTVLKFIHTAAHNRRTLWIFHLLFEDFINIKIMHIDQIYLSFASSAIPISLPLLPHHLYVIYFYSYFIQWNQTRVSPPSTLSNSYLSKFYFSSVFLPIRAGISNKKKDVVIMPSIIMLF